jgi:hypothetical protein
MRQWFSRATLVLLAACTDPEPTLQITGVVLSAETGSPIAGAHVELWFRAAFDPATQILSEATTGIRGRFSMVIGPPPGYAYANCLTLKLAVSAPGYYGFGPYASIGGADDPDCKAGAIEVPPIRLNPAPAVPSAAFKTW